VKTYRCRYLGRDLGDVAEVLLSCCDCSPGAQLAEVLDVGVDKMDWLETSWSQALLLIHCSVRSGWGKDQGVQDVVRPGQQRVA
jgi:hypothetical protein